MAEIGSIIQEKYEILKLIGKGGMSKVYLAMDQNLNKQWAVKEIEKRSWDENNEVIIQSAIAEANMIKKLDHPFLPRIVDIIDKRNVTGMKMYLEDMLSNANTDEIPDTQKEMDALNLWLKDNNPIDKMLNEDPEGTKGIINNILQKDVSEWNEIEAQFIADLLSYATDAEDAEILELIIEGMVCIGISDEFDVPVSQWPEQINPEFMDVIKADHEKINRILKYIDAENDVMELAFLNEFYKFEMTADPLIFADNMAQHDFLNTTGVKGYSEIEGNRLIDCGIVYQDGDINMFIRLCPDGKMTDYMANQPIYGIYLSEEMQASNATINSIESELQEMPEYQELKKKASENWVEVESALLKFCKVSLGYALKEGSNFVIGKTVFSPYAKVCDVTGTISKEMLDWLAKNEELVSQITRRYMELWNDSRQATANFLNMNMVVAYSGEVQGISFEDWENMYNSDAHILSKPAWKHVNDPQNLSAGDFTEMTYLGKYDGGLRKSTEDMVNDINQTLEDIMKKYASEDKGDFTFEEGSYIKRISEWIDNNSDKNINELTYEDYINMDADTIFCVKKLVDRYGDKNEE